MPNRSRKRYRSRSRSRSEKGVLEILKRMDKRLKLLENKNTDRKRRLVSSSGEESSSDVSNSDYSQISDDEIHSDVRNADNSMDNQGLALDDEQGPSTSKDTEDIQPEPLDEGLLAVLGDDVNPKTILGQPLQPQIAERWLHIAKNGLDETVLKQIMEKYPPPENGTLLGPPQLNLIVKQAVHESVERRDEKLAKIQSRLAASLSAIGQVMTKILEKKGGGEGDEVKYYIETLSDAGRLIIDVIHSESVSRRALVSYDLNKNWKDTLTEAPLDNWLFGEDLEGRLKTAKELQVSSMQLKTSRNNLGKNTLNSSRSRSLPHLNSRSLPQHQQGVKRGRRDVRETPHNRQRQGRTWDRNQNLTTKSRFQSKERNNKKFRRN